MYDVKWFATKQDAWECLYLREAVFVDEQKFTLEIDEIDDLALHLLIKDQETPIGAARLFPKENGSDTYIAGRICTNKDYRGKKIGARIMEEVEKKARELGAKKMELDAQSRIRGFYEHLGYEECGEEHYDEYCLHIPMAKQL